MALQKHLGDAGGAAEVTVYLERRVNIPEVGCGIFFKEVLKEVVRALTVLHSRPEVQSVCDAPAGGIVSALCQGVCRGVKPCRSCAVYEVSGIETDEL